MLTFQQNYRIKTEMQYLFISPGHPKGKQTQYSKKSNWTCIWFELSQNGKDSNMIQFKERKREKDAKTRDVLGLIWQTQTNVCTGFSRKYVQFILSLCLYCLSENRSTTVARRILIRSSFYLIPYTVTKIIYSDWVSIIIIKKIITVIMRYTNL